MADDELIPPRDERTIRVAADRVLGVAEFGPADGKAIFWFHGTPGAKPPGARRPPAGPPTSYGVRLIGVERPGTGSSTGHLYRDIRAFADDIEVLADALDIDRFGIIGLSGGGPYVLACAHELPHRVVGAVVLGGVAPTFGDHAGEGGIVDLTRRLRTLIGITRQPLALFLTGFARVLRPFGPQALYLYTRISPPGDRAAFASPGLGRCSSTT